MHPFRQCKKYIIPDHNGIVWPVNTKSVFWSKNTIVICCRECPLLPSKEKRWLQAQVRTCPSFPCSNNILVANNIYFPITSLCTIHGPVDILAHRHNHGPPLPTPSPPYQREAATTSAGQNVSLLSFFLIPFWQLIILIFSITSLCTIHGPVDILAHRHNHRPPPPTPSPLKEKQRPRALVRLFPLFHIY